MRSFRDSNGDGTGDFKGLTEKLDYLQWLGVDCLWVPPFFSSPLRDGGYDVADYTNILPECGSVEDFHTFLDEAHKRDIRVIIDFVMNHTSDQHGSSRRPRRTRTGRTATSTCGRTPTTSTRTRGSSSSTPSRRTGRGTRPAAVLLAPVLLAPAGPELRQPQGPRGHARGDLVLVRHGPRRVPARRRAVPLRAPRHQRRELPETHQFLKMVRTYVDEHYPGRVLLAEANQWPADVVDYFGDFEKRGRRVPHVLPLPRHAAHLHGGPPRVALPDLGDPRAGPPIPSGTQWGIFLRNHDELTLEMVSDEDRDYMWGEYAKDPRMKANIIRRRLALLDNDINQIELFNALLLSLPGSPVLYYGDEIGMGDERWLGDRDGVRTPMQWTPDRNAGFSSATPGKLHLPVIQDPVYGYSSVNVEAQLENSSSLLHWTRRMIQARRQHDAFGLGSFTDLGGSNPTVLSYVRDHVQDDGRHDVILCVNNLSVPAAGRARPAPLGGHGPVRAAGRPLPRRRAPVPPHAGRLRLLLVPDDQTRHRRRARRDRSPRDPRPRTSGRRGGSAARAAPSRSPAGGASARSPATSRAVPGWRSTWRRCPTRTAGRTEYYQIPSPSTPSRRSACPMPWSASGTTRTSVTPMYDAVRP